MLGHDDCSYIAAYAHALSAPSPRPLPRFATARVHSHMLAAIDVQFGPCHVARLIRAQIIDRLGDFLRQAETAQRNRLHDLVGTGREDRGVDLAGRDRIDAHAERAEVRRHLARQGGERRLRRRISRAGERMHTPAGDGRDVDDGALRARQLVLQSARQPDGGEEIDFEDMAPLRHLGRQRGEARALLALG